MKKSIRVFWICLAIIGSLVVVQSLWAETCNITASGVITDINYDENKIIIDEVTVVNGIPLMYLANKLNIVLYPDDNVVVTASQCPTTGNLRACTISVNLGPVISLPGNRMRY